MNKCQYVWTQGSVDSFLTDVSEAIHMAKYVNDVKAIADLLRLKFDILTSELEFSRPDEKGE